MTRLARLQVFPPPGWSPPFLLDQPGLRRASRNEALRHERPHRIVAVGGPHDGYEEWWVSDVPCGCDHSEDPSV